MSFGYQPWGSSLFIGSAEIINGEVCGRRQQALAFPSCIINCFFKYTWHIVYWSNGEVRWGVCLFLLWLHICSSLQIEKNLIKCSLQNHPIILGNSRKTPELFNLDCIFNAGRFFYFVQYWARTLQPWSAKTGCMHVVPMSPLSKWLFLPLQLCNCLPVLNALTKVP